jgi:hypothetical protein
MSFRRLRPSQPAHEALDALMAAGQAVPGDQILPDGHGVAAADKGEFDQFTVGFRGTGGRTASRTPGVSGHFLGSFCRVRLGG